MKWESEEIKMNQPPLVATVVGTEAGTEIVEATEIVVEMKVENAAHFIARKDADSALITS